MKLSLNWLQDYIDLGDQSPEQVADLLTFSGLEVEGSELFERIPGSLEGVVIGQVLSCQPHPDADKLKLTTVDAGQEAPLPIVCGAPNVAEGQKVAVATVGTTLHPIGGESFKIKKSKIRGQTSQGMICAEDELGLGPSHQGILVLDTALPNGTPAADYFRPEKDTVLEIGLTPNRADGASHLGAARDLKALLGRPLTEYRRSEVKGPSARLPIEIRIENPEDCPRYAGVVVKGVTVAPSPQWLQSRLKAIGLSPINNLVDITNFVLHGLGQPLHAFDYDQIAGQQIIVRRAEEGQTFTTLDGQERQLFANNLMIGNAAEPMAIGGVFGGAESGITEGTKNIFIESAYFHPDSIRKTALQHGLKTDASFRYERGTDPEMVLPGLAQALELVLELAGGEVASEVKDVYPRQVEPFQIQGHYQNIRDLIGADISNQRITEILQDLEIEVLHQGEEFMARVPAYRVDVQREADLVEEVLRIYGYNQVPLSEGLATSYLASFPKVDKEALQARVAEILSARGCFEFMTNSLCNPAYAEQVSGFDPAANVRMSNYSSEELSVLRQSLLFTALESLEHNLNRQQERVWAFEFGKKYQWLGNRYKEKDQLILLATGPASPPHWADASRPSHFHDLAALVEAVFAKLNLTDIGKQPAEVPYLDYGLSYDYQKTALGFAGLLSKKTAKAFDLEQEVFYAELDWEALVALYSEEFEVEEVPRFPTVRRDLSLLLDRSVSYQQLQKAAQKSAGALLKEIRVFDVYQGEKIEAGKKAYALSFYLRDDQKTLTDKQINKTMEKLQQALNRETGAELRA